MTLNSKAPALTLVEVLAALVLAGGVITSLLVAHSQSLEQLRATQELAKGTQLARELVYVWQIEPQSVRGIASGDFASVPQWSWTRVRHASAPEVFEYVLTVYRIHAEGTRRAITSVTWLEHPASDAPKTP